MRVWRRRLVVQSEVPLVPMAEGSAGALEWAEGRVDAAALRKVRAKTAQNVASAEQPIKTPFRVAGTKPRGGPLDVAKSVGRDSGFEPRRRLARRYDPRTTGLRAALLDDIVRTQGAETAAATRGIDERSETAREFSNAPVEIPALQHMCSEEARAHQRLHARRPTCAQDVKADVPAYVNARQASVNPKPMKVDGVQGIRESAGHGWGANDVGAVQQ